MRILASFLILLLCISDKAQSFSCDSVFSKMFQLTGAAVSEVPVAATFFNIFNFIAGETTSGDCITEDIRNIAKEVAMEEDRKQEFRQAASTLKAHTLTLREIESYSDVKNNFWKYESLRHDMRRERLKYFDPFEHHHESKFKLFTQWGNTELALIDIMIIAKREDYAKYSKIYGDTLLYYIKKGSEMFSKFPLELIHKRQTDRDVRIKRVRDVAKYAEFYLRPILVEWIEAVETKTEIRKRLRHKGLNSQPSDDSSQWDRLGADRNFLPLKISDGDWISMKFPTWASWLSCYESISENKVCRMKNKFEDCSNVYGGKGANECKGERFQIQSTAHGPIKFWEKIAFKYWDWDCSEGRGKGTYWLSNWLKRSDKVGAKFAIQIGASPKLRTMPCVGGTFTKHDIANCKNEIFVLMQGIDSGLRFGFGSGKAKYLRNGDMVFISDLITWPKYPTTVESVAFIMKQFRQTGDKNYC